MAGAFSVASRGNAKPRSNDATASTGGPTKEGISEAEDVAAARTSRADGIITLIITVSERMTAGASYTSFVAANPDGSNAEPNRHLKVHTVQYI